MAGNGAMISNAEENASQETTVRDNGTAVEDNTVHNRNDAAKVDATLNKNTSKRRTKKKMEEMKAKYHTWSSEAFDEVAAGSSLNHSPEHNKVSTQLYQSTNIENMADAEQPPATVNRRSTSRQRKKSRSETLKKHLTWHQGWTENFACDSEEDEMIASIEDFIKEYVEQALSAEYFKKITNNVNTCRDVGNEAYPASSATTPTKKKGSLMRRLRDTISRSYPGSKSNSFDDGTSPQPTSNSSTPGERRKKMNGMKDESPRSGSPYSRKEEDMILDDIERRLIQQVNQDMPVPIEDLLLVDR